MIAELKTVVSVIMSIVENKCTATLYVVSISTDIFDIINPCSKFMLLIFTKLRHNVMFNTKHLSNIPKDYIPRHQTILLYFDYTNTNI